MFISARAKVYSILLAQHLKIVRLTPSKLKPLRITQIVKEGDLLSSTQRDENFKADSGKGVYPNLWTGEFIFEVLEERVDRNLPTKYAPDDLRVLENR